MMNKSLVAVMKEMGLTAKHAQVYEKLLQNPESTPLLLSRATKLNRSSLYRYLEELRERGLVELIMSDKSSRYLAAPEGLEQCLASEEVRVTRLQKLVPELVQELGRVGQARARSEVKYYQGREGLKQMLWNVVASNQEFVGLGYENWNTSVGKSFADKLRAKMMETGVYSKELLNEVEDEFEYTTLGKTYKKVYEHRAIDPKVLTIKHDTYIYGEVFAYYYHYQGEYFGVEIHNAEIARTERQMFEILWRMTDTTH